MFGNASSPKVRLSVALGLLLASFAGAATAVEGRDTAAADRIELIPADRASQLPVELRAYEGVPSISEALGLAEATGSHTVQLRWLVRENRRELSGYRVTLVAADGLPGHLGARWWVSPAHGTPVANGLTAYSAEISLALDGAVPIAATLEAVDADGHAVLLGLRRSIASADTDPTSTVTARPGSVAANPGVLHFSRLSPSARAAAPAPGLLPPPAERLALRTRLTFARRIHPGGSVSERGPPAVGLST